jgi:hypothetical protein
MQLTLLPRGRVSPRPADHDDRTVVLLFDALHALHPDSASYAVMQIIDRLDLTDPLTKKERLARTVELEQARQEAVRIVDAEQWSGTR